jgi:diguanylate cyclase (GGDEF)-like protein
MAASALNRAVLSAAGQPGFTARYGGEDFACAPWGPKHEQAKVIADQIRKHVPSLDMPHEKSAACAHAAVGVATARCSFETADDLWVSAADHAFCKAKASGRNKGHWRDSRVRFDCPSADGQQQLAAPR